MRAGGKLAGVVNASFRGGIPAVAVPEHLSSKGRTIAGVLSSSDAQIDGSTVNKVCSECDDDWEFPQVEEAMPRLVFGGPPSLQEAKDATSQLRTALDEYVLSVFLFRICKSLNHIFFFYTQLHRSFHHKIEWLMSTRNSL